MKNALNAALAAVALLASGTASAQSLDGATLDYQYYYPNSSSPYGGADNGSFVVGPGVEVSNIADSTGTIDISGTNILVDFSGDSSWNSAAFNGWILSDQTDSLAAILGVTINPATNMSGFSLSNISWTGDTIAVNWQGLAFNPDTVVSLDVVTSQGAVPEPATWAMMLLGFGAAGTAIRRSRRKTGLLAQIA
jgi:hypothetical protein